MSFHDRGGRRGGDPGGGGGGLPGGGSGRGLKDERPFCERHRTLCSVGSKIWNAVPGIGPRWRSGCWTVEDGAIDAFRAGRVAQYKVWTTQAAIADAWNISFEEVERRLTYAGIADSHLYQFIPICLQIESGKHQPYTKEGEAVAVQLRRVAYEAFKAGIRSGVIVPGQAGAHERRGGDLPGPGRGGAPPPGRGGGGGGGGGPAGESGGVGLLLAGVAAYYATRG